MRVAFFYNVKQKSRPFGALLQHSAQHHGDTVERFSQKQLNQLEGFDAAAALGALGLGWHELQEACRKYNKRLLYFDKGYTREDATWRFSVDAWQPFHYFQSIKRPGDRYATWPSAFQLKPWRSTTPDGHILLAGGSQTYATAMGFGDVNEYHRALAAKIAQHTDRSIVYRPHPSWARRFPGDVKALGGTILSQPSEGFASALVNCHTVVSYGTQAALYALAQGVPNFVLGPSIVRPLALTENEWYRLEETNQPSDELRRQFFYDLAYQQFTHKEFMAGYAWAAIRRTLAFLEPQELAA